MANTPQPSRREAIGLVDARTLFYAEYGSPDGTPVLFFHGFPGSHKEAAMWHDAAVRHSIRLISPDRPGIGLSSYEPGRRFVDWPADVAQLAKHLNIGSCHVLATAGGSPYALACLRRFGRDASDQGSTASSRALQVQNVAIVSGIYPLALGASGVKLSTRITLWIVGHIWFLLVPLLEFLLGKPARQNPSKFEARMMREAQGRPLVDRKCLEDKQYADAFLEAARHAFARDARGVAYEVGLMGRPWGYDLNEIEPAAARRITIWQGGFDDTCPVSMARKAHERLQGSTLRVFEYEGHLSLTVRRKDDILNALLKVSYEDRGCE
jgi:pimeloyl-ACP methyl ester carboxylesterase